MARFPSLITAIIAAVLVSSPARAADKTVPYWASLRVDEVNMRAGPGEDYRISWVYRRKHLPFKVLRLKEGWRLVQDPGGTTGWVLAQFLSRERGAIVAGNGTADMRDKPQAGARLMWRLEPGVTGKLGNCTGGWCQLDLVGRSGFVEQDRLWGAGEP
jgi:SH3-like domain-containing protein